MPLSSKHDIPTKFKHIVYDPIEGQYYNKETDIFLCKADLEAYGLKEPPSLTPGDVFMTDDEAICELKYKRINFLLDNLSDELSPLDELKVLLAIKERIANSFDIFVKNDKQHYVVEIRNRLKQIIDNKKQ